MSDDRMPRDTEPLVSVIVLYHKRPDTIGDVLHSAANQDYPNREIVLVDNHSDDGVARIAGQISASIRVIELPENCGACAGRNAGIRNARGEILVCLDDDVKFESRSELTKIVNAFRGTPWMHVLALQICDPRTRAVRTREWCHTRPYDEYVEKEFETNWFGEGASAFRREVFDECGLYYEPLFYGAEGHDMVLRILDRGFRVLHTPDIRVDHWASERGRSVRRQYYYFTRNFIWMAYKDYHCWHGIRFLIPKVLMMLYFAHRVSAYRTVLSGIWDGIKGLPLVRRDRTPVSAATIEYMAKQEKWRPGIWERFGRHRLQPQL